MPGQLGMPSTEMQAEVPLAAACVGGMDNFARATGEGTPSFERPPLDR